MQSTPSETAITDTGGLGAELDYASPAIPGGSFLSSIHDRTFMQLSDRGGASNTIGDRWAELCASSMTHHSSLLRPPATAGNDIGANVVVRLDDIPEIARTASRQQLQNPDFLLVSEVDGCQHIWAADAKFSVDTARSKQVSADVVKALLDMGDTVTSLLPTIREDAEFHDGVFLCPDYSLTHRLLADRRGPRKATVTEDEVRFVPVTSDEFLAPMGQAGLREYLAELDQFPFDPRRRLMVGLYYYRLARTAIGFWQDETGPLLSYRDTPAVDVDAVEAAARTIATMRTSAWGLMLRWNDRADLVRNQRLEVDQATAVPINGKQLREQIGLAAEAAGVVAPSASKVRRMAGSWFRSQVREEFGPIPPPVENFPALLQQLGKYTRSRTADVAVKTNQIIEDLLAEAPAVTDQTP